MIKFYLRDYENDKRLNTKRDKCKYLFENQNIDAIALDLNFDVFYDQRKYPKKDKKTKLDSNQGEEEDFRCLGKRSFKQEHQSESQKINVEDLFLQKAKINQIEPEDEEFESLSIAAAEVPPEQQQNNISGGFTEDRIYKRLKIENNQISTKADKIRQNGMKKGYIDSPQSNLGASEEIFSKLKQEDKFSCINDLSDFEDSSWIKMHIGFNEGSDEEVGQDEIVEIGSKKFRMVDGDFFEIIDDLDTDDCSVD